MSASDQRIAQLEQLITELQSQLSFQEDEVQSVSRRLLEQDNELARLTLQIQHLNKRLKENEQGSGNSAGFNPANERPPHY